jgi:uncharacterized protein YecT (DUF1311 family)
MRPDLRPDHEPSVPPGAYQEAVRRGSYLRRARRNRIATGGVLALALVGSLFVQKTLEGRSSELIPADRPTVEINGPLEPTPAPTPSVSGSVTNPAALRYRPIVEPFATPQSCAPGDENSVEDCRLGETLAVDRDIDALQRERFERAPISERATLLADDRTWLAHRQTFCSEQAGDRETGPPARSAAADCLLASSRQRRLGLQQSG